MQYALLIHENEAESYPDGEAGKAWQDILTAHTAFGGELAEAGAMRGGAGLKSTATATTEAKKPASKPTPSNSMRCTWRNRAELAPTARRIANSRSRSPRVAVMAVISTTKPAAKVKTNKNSTAAMT